MKSVLVIDDDSDVREVIVFALENDGFQVMSAGNGLEALKILTSLSSEEYPGLMIVDYLMPEMDGIALIKELKTKYADTLGKIPMLFSSAMDTADQDERLMEGVLTLYKPMDLDDLLKVVRQYCS